jgi:hypothetical protein
MCVIIYVSETGKVSEDRLHEAYTANPDGCGVLWAKNGRLICHKGNYSFEDFMVFYKRAASPLIVHFRTASSGAISNDAAHPLFVNDNFAFAQNGNYPEYSIASTTRDVDLTDVQRFNELFLKNLPPDFLDHPDIHQALEAYCVNRMVKMVFMDNFGKVKIINEAAGEWVDGCWFSNGGISGYVGYGYSGAYPLKEGEVRHFGGLQSVMTFDEKERKKWSQCKTCLGWFPNKEIQKSACVGCREWKKLVEFTK